MTTPNERHLWGIVCAYRVKLRMLQQALKDDDWTRIKELILARVEPPMGASVDYAPDDPGWVKERQRLAANCLDLERELRRLIDTQSLIPAYTVCSKEIAEWLGYEVEDGKVEED
jgi:hypothetical protein